MENPTVEFTTIDTLDDDTTRRVRLVANELIERLRLEDPTVGVNVLIHLAAAAVGSRMIGREDFVNVMDKIVEDHVESSAN
jgi:hypothetical protein